jgi:acetyl esterase/lipase
VPAQASDPRASPLLAENLSGLAPAFVVTAASHDKRGRRAAADGCSA